MPLSPDIQPAQKLKTAEVIRSIIPKISLLPAINRSSTNSEAIKILQNSLRLLGYFFDATDGSYGEISREALMYFQLEAGVIQNPQDPGAGVFGEKTKAALGQALIEKLHMIEAGKKFPPSSLTGLSFEEERRLARHSIYQEITHSHNVRNRTYPGRLQDHEILLENILGRIPGDENIKILKDILIRPEMDRLLFIDIGPGIANKDLDVRGGRGKPAISLQEVAQKFTTVQCIALDMPSEVDIFTGKTSAKQAGYSIHSEDRNALLAKQNMHLISGNGLYSLKQQLENPATNPYPNRPRPTPTKNSTIVVRAANSIDLYANWENQMKPALAKMAEDFRENPIILLFNREILVKPAHSTTWKLIGQVSGMGFRHNDRALTRSGHPPFFLYEDKVRSLKETPPLESVSQIPTGTEEGARGQHVRLLQSALRDLGYFKVDITGQFGSRTKESLIKFQLAHRIIDSREARGAGVFGPKTKLALVEALKNLTTTERQQKRATFVADRVARTRTRTYVTTHMPEYASLCDGAHPTLASIGPLETLINEHYNRNTFLKNEKHLTKEEQRDLAHKRYRCQAEYLEKLVEYRRQSTDPRVLAVLSKLNLATRDYREELEDLNKQIGEVMHPECAMSIVLPAYQEGKNIEKTLQDWMSQVDEKGIPVDPKKFELIIFINKPYPDSQFDDTEAKIKDFKRRHPEYQIFCVKKSFNCAKETETRLVHGKTVTIEKGPAMGLVYKMCGDLAVLRNCNRAQNGNLENMAKAGNHLIRTGGADAYGRNPTFLANIMRTFKYHPPLDQLKSEADYPPTVFEKIPLLHIVQRFRQSFNRLYTAGSSVYGLGTYRASLYAHVDGFNPQLHIREELNLAEKMIKIKKDGVSNIYKAVTINALEDPRRTVYTILKGQSPLGEYGDFHSNNEVRQFQIENIPAVLPEGAVLNKKNLSFQLSKYAHFFLKKAFTSGSSKKGDFDACFEMSKQYTTICLLSMGFEIDDFDILKGTGIDDPNGSINIQIKNLEYVQGALDEYKKSEKPLWMRKMRG